MNRSIVRAILLDVISNDSEAVMWNDIVIAVSAKMNIKNWLDVRSVLQELLDEELIERTPSVYVEEYVKL
tara:strand:- start:63312 stop:63521 length:210 start_codon:yes stop_codon:yes gene_type:complete